MSMTFVARYFCSQRSVLATLGLLIASVIAWFTQHNVTLYTALSGFTPVGMMHPLSSVAELRGDFPSGEAEMMKSLVGHVYWLLGWAGLSDFAGALLVVTAEAATLFAGGSYFARQVNPHLPSWTAFAAAIMLGASGLASADFGRWGHPIYGSVYNFGYGLGLAAIAATLDRRLWLAGALLGLAATIHPIIALFFAIPTGIVTLFSLRSYSSADFIVSALLAVGLAGAWFIFAYGGTTTADNAVDGHLFVTLTRLMSFHWHPLHLGVFGERAWESVLPATALLSLSIVMMATAPLKILNVDRQLAAGVSALLGTAVAGVYLSEVSHTPLVIKLALQRASLVAFVIAAGLSVPRLLFLTLNGPVVPGLFAAALIALAFVRPHGLPILGVIIFIVLMLPLSGGANLILSPNRRRLIGFSLILSISVPLLLFLNGHSRPVMMDTKTAFAALFTGSVIIPFLLLLAARARSRSIFAIAAICVGAFLWGKDANPINEPAKIKLATDFHDIQLWAREHTSPDSVFMIEPTMPYGWRQYSERPSFGTLREWLYAGWIYKSDMSILAEGLRRTALLGVTRQDLEKYAWTMERKDAYPDLTTRIRSTYNAFDRSALAQLSRENGISYFVFNRSFRPDFADLDIAYQNDSFAVVEPAP